MFLGWHPTLFQAALASSVVCSFGLAVLIGKALRYMDEIDRRRRIDDLLNSLRSDQLPPGFQIIPERPYDWSVDA